MVGARAGGGGVFAWWAGFWWEMEGIGVEGRGGGEERASSSYAESGRSS